MAFDRASQDPKSNYELKELWLDLIVNYNIIATTSKVPSTKYRDTAKGGLGGGNEALATARYNTMLSAFTEAGKTAEIPG